MSLLSAPFVMAQKKNQTTVYSMRGKAAVVNIVNNHYNKLAQLAHKTGFNKHHVITICIIFHLNDLTEF